MPLSGATPACEALPRISTVQRSAPIAPIDHVGGAAAVDVEAHRRVAEVGRVDVLRAEEAALLAHREEQRQRRMGQFLLDEFGRAA